MRWIVKFARIAVHSLLGLIILAGCQSPSQPPSTVDDQADIFAAVIMRLYGVENHVIPQSFPVLYIAQTLQAGSDGSTGTLDKPLQSAIQQRISSLPARVNWVATHRDVPWETDGTWVKDGGAGITLGSIQNQKDGTVQVAGSIVYANLGAWGGTFVLEKQDGKWVVTGTTGPEWIS